MENGYPTRAEINHMWMTNDEEEMCKMYDYMVAMHNEIDRLKTEIDLEKTRSAVYFSAGQALEKELKTHQTGWIDKRDRYDMEV